MSRAVTTPSMDFWVAGGASLACWLGLLAVYGTGLNASPIFAGHLASLSATFGVLGLVVNSPHFYWSYKLAYGQGSAFARRYWWQMLAVPALLLATFAAAGAAMVAPGFNAALLGLLAPLADATGWRWYLDFYPTAGHFLVGSLLVAQYTTLGWHYAKQTFGVVLTQSHMTGYRLGDRQRTLLRWCLFGVWFNYLCNVNAGPKVLRFAGFTHHNLDWPTWVAPASGIYLVAMLVALGAFVVIPNRRTHGAWPHARVIAPFVALYLWFVPAVYLMTPGFFTLFVPFFHSLQYLAFVSRYEKNAYDRRPGSSPARVALLTAGVVGTGFFLYNALPTLLERHVPVTAGFFGTAAYLFLNLHHYFIDNVIWRKENVEFRSTLLAHLAPAPKAQAAVVTTAA